MYSSLEITSTLYDQNLSLFRPMKTLSGKILLSTNMQKCRYNVLETVSFFKTHRAMSKRGVFQWLAVLGFSCLIISFIEYNYKNTLALQTQLSLEVQSFAENIEDVQEADDSSEETRRQVIDLQRELIRREMEGYRYPNGKYNMSARGLEDLVIERNGRPIRSIIVTTWRSGSTFFGDILNSHPGNFYHYEPLADFNIVQVRGPPLASQALKRVRALLDCEYAGLGDAIEYGKTDPWFFNQSSRLWTQCEAHKGLCYDHKFLTGMCKLFPFQSMKLVHLSLNIAQELLADEESPVRMVLLVRDPRGTLRSRKHLEWCQPNRDCSDPGLLCADLASDYRIAVKLLKQYPSTFRVIRYEDLAAEPYERVRELSEFYGLDFHEDIKAFLDTRTKHDRGGAYSTFRNSKETPYHWREKLKFEEVEEIQRYCAVAMEHWGYLPVMNATHQREFNPITDYVLN